MDYRVVQAMRLLEQRMDQDVNFDRIAEEVGLSRHHFHRVFAQASGETPAKFLRRIRLDYAALRLRWTSEPSVTIAHSLGYLSRAAFTRAFQHRYGLPPASFRREIVEPAVDPSSRNSRVALKEVDTFHILVKRYVGALRNMAEHWEDFLASLPSERQNFGRAMFAGLMYDDPRSTPADRTRYECGIIVGRDFRCHDDELKQRGLHLVMTRSGRYCTLHHKGPASDIEQSYEELGAWARREGHLVTEDPAIEIHAVPRSRQPPECRDFTILLAVE